MINTNIISLNEAHMFLKSLVIHNETICINNLEMAKWFTNIYYKEVIDPNVLINGEIFKASDLSNNIKEINKNALDKATKGIFLRIV